MGRKPECRPRTSDEVSGVLYGASRSCCNPPREKVLATQDHEVANDFVSARQTMARLLSVRPAAKLLQHMARRGIVVKPAPPDRFGFQVFECEERNTARGFAGIALAPVRLA